MSSERNIERLIASAFDGLGPSAAVEDEIRGGLPVERARPPRVRPGTIVVSLVVLLALGAVGIGRAAFRPTAFADEGETPDLPVIEGAAAGAARGVVRVRLTPGGRILVPGEGEAREPRSVSLAGLGEWLGRRAREFHERETAAGRSGYEERAAAGVRVSRVQVIVVADAGAPWVHVQWILLTCAEQGMARVAFAVKDAEGKEHALDAALPVDAGLEAGGEIRVRVAVRAERAPAPGFPRRVWYEYGDQTSEDLADVRTYLEAALEAVTDVHAVVCGEIRAGRTIPHRDVAAVLAEFRRARYERVDFYGTRPPDARLREAEVLPQPESDWPRKGEEKAEDR